MEDLIRHLVSSFVSKPDEIQIQAVKGDAVVLYELSVDSEDFEATLGEKGRTARAIRTILSAAAGSTKVSLDLIDPDAEE